MRVLRGIRSFAHAILLICKQYFKTPDISIPYTCQETNGQFLLLTSLTVHTASAADRGAAKGAAANRAWFSAVSVNSKKRCVSIIFSFGLQIIFRRNRIFLNKIFQAFRDRNLGCCAGRLLLKRLIAEIDALAVGIVSNRCDTGRCGPPD